MISTANGSVRIQTSSEPQFATPSWLSEVAVVACHLQKRSLLNKISERVRFARRRFDRAWLQYGDGVNQVRDVADQRTFRRSSRLRRCAYP